MRRVFVSGANSGIGRALAREYARRGAELWVSVRRKKVAQEIAQECEQLGAAAVNVAILDYEKTERCIKYARDIALRVDGALLCAGVSQRATALETQPAVLEKLFRVNALSPMALTRTFLSSWEERGSGLVAVVSSIAATAPIPLRSAYCAAKRALEIYVDTMANEMASPRYGKKKNMNITTIVPGFVTTRVTYNALTADGNMWGTMDPRHKKGMDPDTAARNIARSLDTRKIPRRIYIGMNASLFFLSLLTRYAPRIANAVLARVSSL